MKLYRLDRIFSADIGRVGKNRLTDAHMFFGLGCIIFGELVVLGIFFLLAPPVPVTYETEIVAGSEILVAIARGWKAGDAIGTILLLIFNFCLLFLGLIGSVRLRNIPSNFKESQFNLVTVTVISLDVLIICPLTALQIDHVNSIAIQGFGVLFATFAIWGTYFVPKIWFVLKNIQVTTQEQTGATHEDIVAHRKNLAILRAHLGPLFLASGTSAQKAPEVLLDEIMSQLQIPCDESDLVNIETRTELMALWCLPPPVTTLVSSGPSNKGSSYRSKERSNNGSVGSRQKADSEPLSESRNPLVGIDALEMSSAKSPRERTITEEETITIDSIGADTGGGTEESEMSKSNV